MRNLKDEVAFRAAKGVSSENAPDEKEVADICMRVSRADYAGRMLAMVYDRMMIHGNIFGITKSLFIAMVLEKGVSYRQKALL